jgi:hypothetical protein
MTYKGLMRLAIVAAAVLGVVTGEFISLAKNNLPFGEKTALVTDLLSSPGGIVAGVFYPEGISSGGMGVAYIAVAVNWFFYSVFWYLMIRFSIALIRKVLHFPSDGSAIRP